MRLKSSTKPFIAKFASGLALVRDPRIALISTQLESCHGYIRCIATHPEPLVYSA